MLLCPSLTGYNVNADSWHSITHVEVPVMVFMYSPVSTGTRYSHRLYIEAQRWSLLLLGPMISFDYIRNPTLWWFGEREKLVPWRYRKIYSSTKYNLLGVTCKFTVLVTGTIWLQYPLSPTCRLPSDRLLTFTNHKILERTK